MNTDTLSFFLALPIYWIIKSKVINISNWITNLTSRLLIPILYISMAKITVYLIFLSLVTLNAFVIRFLSYFDIAE